MPVELNPMVKNTGPGLAVVGVIKSGEKGEKKTSKGGKEFFQPRMFNYFKVRTLKRDGEKQNLVDDVEIHEMLGSPEPTEIPIMLLFDELHLNMQSYYLLYKDNKTFCRGDGVKANRIDVDEPIPCPCEKNDWDHDPYDHCKKCCDLFVMIRGAKKTGGVWKYHTAGHNSVEALTSSLSIIQVMTHGVLAGLELNLVVNPKTTQKPGGGTTTFPVATVLYYGTPEQLAESGLRILEVTAGQRQKMAQIEASAASLIDTEVAPVEDIIAEFHPEQQVGYENPNEAPDIDLDAAMEVKQKPPDKPAPKKKPPKDTNPIPEPPTVTEPVPDPEPEPDPAPEPTPEPPKKSIPDIPW